MTIKGTAPANAEVGSNIANAPDDHWNADGGGNWMYQPDLSSGDNHFDFFLQDDTDIRAQLTVRYEPPPTPTPAPTSTPTVTPTPQPTATPTHTLVPPTATATVAESTPTVGLTDEELAYASEIHNQLEGMEDSLARFAKLMEDPRFFDDSWITSIALELVTWRLTYDDANAMAPPPRFQTFHAKWLEIMQRFYDASFLIADGIDNLDANKIDQATALLLEANALMDEALPLLEEAANVSQ